MANEISTPPPGRLLLWQGRRGGRETTRDALDDEFAHSFGLIRFIACTSLLACHCVRSPLNNPKYLMRPEMCLGER